MTRHEADQVTIAVNDEVTVSGLMVAPAGARACYVMAHGAGAGMAHPFMGAMAAGLAVGVPLVAGGKSFGGRMTSQAQAEAPLPGVRGLVFLGFPLHPAGKPSDQRGQHLSRVEVPMLFLQGSRDQLADLSLLKPLVKRLGQSAVLQVFPDADHSFHVPARSGGNDAEVRDRIADGIAAWV